MILIVGLGNPESKYNGTRHNVGFSVLDQIAENMGASFSAEKKSNALVARGDFNGTEVILFKPMTYMNRSGEAVAAYTSFYKIDPEQIIVIHDELDIPFGNIKLVEGGGSGGNNGVASIASAMQTNDPDTTSSTGRSITRIKVGIANKSLDRARALPVEAKKRAVGDFVLSKFSFMERFKIGDVIDSVIEKLASII